MLLSEQNETTEMIYCPWCRQEHPRDRFTPKWHAPGYPPLVRCRVCGTDFSPREQVKVAP